MNADRDLTEAYQEWRRLAETEGEAIRTRNWGLVAACQKTLQQLQERINRLSADARAEWAEPGADGAARERMRRDSIHELIRLERRNQTLLNAIRETTRAKLDELKLAGRNLKRLQGSYGQAQSAAWSSFS